MSDVIIICGPAATGKTTIVNELIKKYNGFFLRPCDSYFKLGKEKNIASNNVFNEIEDEEAGKEYNKICLDHELVICDQHMAIQFNKDTKIATGNYTESNNEEEYVNALSKEFIDAFLTNEIRLLVICLYANPTVLQDRAIKRNKENGFIIRNNSIELTEKELNKELYFYNKFVSDYMVEGEMIDTSDLNKEEVFENVVQRIEQFRRKKKLTLEWTK